MDLFTWSDSKQVIIKQQMSFNGQVVEWNCLEGLKTGVVVETDLSDEESQAGQEISESTTAEKLAETVKFDDNPQGRSVALALDILDHLDADGPFRLQLITNFKNPQNIRTLNPKEFITRFGMALKNYQNGDPGFWDNLKRRFQELFRQKPAA